MNKTHIHTTQYTRNTKFTSHVNIEKSKDEKQSNSVSLTMQNCNAIYFLDIKHCSITVLVKTSSLIKFHQKVSLGVLFNIKKFKLLQNKKSNIAIYVYNTLYRRVF